MSSFINKVANSITNKTGSIIGRDNLTKFTNSINKGIAVRSKYRDFMKPGNVVQLISKSSHMTLQICQSQNDPNRLILLGNGQVGPEFPASNFTIEVDSARKHFKFRNGFNYVCYDNDIPCILRETNDKYNAIRARNEFRLHEILGSDEYFSLESVYFPGKYLAVLPDGSITTSKNKSDSNTHFCLNVISTVSNPISTPMTPQFVVNTSPVVGVRESAGPASALARDGSNLSDKSGFQSKQEEASYYSNNSSPMQPSTFPPGPPADSPPQYPSLFPKLPQ